MSILAASTPLPPELPARSTCRRAFRTEPRTSAPRISASSSAVQPAPKRRSSAPSSPHALRGIGRRSAGAVAGSSRRSGFRSEVLPRRSPAPAAARRRRRALATRPSLRLADEPGRLDPHGQEVLQRFRPPRRATRASCDARPSLPPSRTSDRDLRLLIHRAKAARDRTSPWLPSPVTCHPSPVFPVLRRGFHRASAHSWSISRNLGRATPRPGA